MCYEVKKLCFEPFEYHSQYLNHLSQMRENENISESQDESQPVCRH